LSGATVLFLLTILAKDVLCNGQRERTGGPG